MAAGWNKENDDFLVVAYTEENESADNYRERFVYDLGNNRKMDMGKDGVKRNAIRVNLKQEVLEKLEKMRRDKFSLDTSVALTYNYGCVAFQR